MKMPRMSVKTRIAAAAVAAALAGGATLATAGPAGGGRGDAGPANQRRVDLHPAAPGSDTAAVRATRQRPAAAAGNTRLRQPGTVV